MVGVVKLPPTQTISVQLFSGDDLTQRKVCEKVCTQPGGCLLYSMTSNLTSSSAPFCWLSSEISSFELFFHQLKWVSFGFGAALGIILTILVGCGIKKCKKCCEDDYEEVRVIKKKSAHPGDVDAIGHVKKVTLKCPSYICK